MALFYNIKYSIINFYNKHIVIDVFGFVGFILSIFTTVYAREASLQVPVSQQSALGEVIRYRVELWIPLAVISFIFLIIFIARTIKKRRK